MAYSIILLENLTELKTRRGNSTSTTIASVLGLDYPTIEAFAFYVWNDTSTATGDDIEIVHPTVGSSLPGRWFKNDLGINAQLILAGLGYIPYNSTNPAGYISSYTETDPTVPSYSKSLTNFLVIKSSTDPLYYSNTNPSNYISSVPPQSFSSLTGKPTTIAGYGITDFNSLGDSRWSVLGHTHTFTSLTSKPTTISGYGITDAYPLTGNPSSFINQAGARAAISLTTTGTGAATYNNSTGVLNIPTSTSKRFETFQVITGGTGTASFTFATAFTNPNVQFNIVGGDVRDTVRLTTISTSGGTITVQRRVDVIGLLPTYSNITGAVVNILVTEN